MAEKNQKISERMSPEEIQHYAETLVTLQSMERPAIDYKISNTRTELLKLIDARLKQATRTENLDLEEE